MNNNIVKEIIKEYNFKPENEKDIKKLLSLSPQKETPFNLDEKIKKYAESKNVGYRKFNLFFKWGLTTVFGLLILIFVFSYYPTSSTNNITTNNKTTVSEIELLDFETELAVIDIELEMIESDMNNNEYIPVNTNNYIPPSNSSKQPSNGSIPYTNSTIKKLC